MTKNCEHCGIVIGPGKRHLDGCPNKGKSRQVNSGAMEEGLREALSEENQTVAAQLAVDYSRPVLRLAALIAKDDPYPMLTARETTTYGEVLRAGGQKAADAWRDEKLASKVSTAEETAPPVEEAVSVAEEVFAG